MKRYKVHNFNSNFFSKPNLLNSYWAGFIAADGCLYKPVKRETKLEIELHAKDKKQLLLFKQLTKFTGPLYNYKNKYFSLSISSNKLCGDLRRNFNITPRKSLTLKPPKGLTKKQALAFIVGYIDGDGCIYFHRKNLAFNVIGTLSVLNWIKTKLKLKTKVKSYGKVYKIQIEGNIIVPKILKPLTALKCSSLDRKWDKLNERNKTNES